MNEKTRSTYHALQVVSLLIIALLLLAMWLGIKPQGDVVTRVTDSPGGSLPVATGQPTEATSRPQGQGSPFTSSMSGEVLPAPQADPPVASQQAQDVYNADPQFTQACMDGAAAGRRTSPRCREVLNALGSGR